MNTFQWLFVVGFFGGLIIHPLIAFACIFIAVLMLAGRL